MKLKLSFRKIMPFAVAVALVLFAGPDASAQSTGPNGGLEIEGITGGVAVPMSAASLPLPANAALETGGNLASLANTTGATGSATPAHAMMNACTDGTNARGLFCDSAGHLSVVAGGTFTVQGASGSPVPLQVVFSTPTRHDFTTSLSASATLLSSGSGVLLGSAASTSAVLGGILCFYDGPPTSGGVLISAFSVGTGALVALTNVPPQGVPYTNGLYVRPGTSVVTCASLGVSLALGFGYAVTIP